MASGLEARPLADYFNTANVTGGNPIITVKLVIGLDQSERNDFLTIGSFLDKEVRELVSSSNFLNQVLLEFQFERNGLLSDRIDVSNVMDGWLTMLDWRAEGQSWVLRHTNMASLPGSFRPSLNFDPQLSGDSRGSGQRPLRILGEGLGLTFPAIRFLERIRTLIASWVWIPPERRPNPTNDPGQESRVSTGGANLPRVFNTLQLDNPREFVQMTADLEKVVPNLGQVTAPLRGNQVTIRIQEPGDIDVTIANASEGVRQSLIIVGTLHTSGPSLVLIEEPEMNLHASAQRQLLSLMKRLGHDLRYQFLVTTHSMIFAQTNTDVASWMVRKTNGKSGIHELEANEDLVSIKHELGHENADFFGYNSVIVIEGESEEIAIPILARGMNLDLASLGVKVYNAHGSGRATKVDHLLTYLKDSDTAAHLILDSHSPIRKSIAKWLGEKLIDEEKLMLFDPEFEDAFNSKTIIAALKRYLEKEGVKVELDVAKLERARERGKPLARFLNKFIHQHTKRDLKKPLFAEILAHTAVELNAIPAAIKDRLLVIGGLSTAGSNEVTLRITQRFGDLLSLAPGGRVDAIDPVHPK
jgi:hypothetical protein